MATETPEQTAPQLPPVSPEAAAQAEATKNRANELFSSGKYLPAIDLYTEAIALNPNIAAYYANRAFAYIRMELYGSAIIDSNKAIELDKNYLKGYYRRGAATMALGRFKESLKDFRMVCKASPRDADAKAKLAECERIVRQHAFAEAINVDEDKRSVADSIDVNAISVEDSYDGPRIYGDTIDREFVLAMMQRFKEQKSIHRKYAYQILLKARALFYSLPPLVDVSIPENGRLTVCGDVHGQYYDLLNIFDLNGLPSEENAYLFNGDFVDRGSFSVEVIFTLFGWRLLLPNHFHMSRGNHETNSMNEMYGFEGEVKSKFNETMYKLFSEIFCAIPLSNLIDNKILVVHGGLFTKDGVTLDDIRKIDRFCQPRDGSLMVDMLWSDPQPEPGRTPNKRGVGVQFGPDVTKRFLDDNNLNMLIRSHEVKQNGYVIDHDGKCVTVFSAPNYCDQMGNKGAFICFKKDLVPDYVTFDAVPHPAIKPMAYATGFGGLI